MAPLSASGMGWPQPRTSGAVNPFASGDLSSLGRPVPTSPPPADRQRVADNGAQLARLEEGIRRAHAVGNAEHVKALGAEYRRLQAEQSQPPGDTVVLNVGGTRVRVGREFLNMSPDEQNRTVEEIAGQIGLQSSQGGEPITVQLPDGKTAQFPAGTSREEMTRAIQKKYPPTGDQPGPMKVFTIGAPDGRKIRIEAPDEATALRGAQEWAEANPTGNGPAATSPGTTGAGRPDAQARYNAALENIRGKYYPQLTDEQWQRAVQESPMLKPYGGQELLTHGMTFGLADEVGAAGNAMGHLFSGKDFGQSWTDFKELHEARRDLGQQQAGLAGGAAELAGGILTGAPAVKAIAGAGSTASQIFKGLAGSGAMGAAYGAGATDGGLQERAIGAGIGGTLGIAGGVAAPVLAKGAQSVARGVRQTGLNLANRPLVRSAPQARQIKAGSKAAFRQMENSGAVIQQPALNILNHDMKQAMRAEGIIRPSGAVDSSFGRVASALDTIDEFAAAPLGMKEAQTVWRSIQRAAGSPDATEARLGMKMLDTFEDWMDSLPPSAVAGNAGEAFNAWMKGRGEWTRFKKVQTLETAIDKASRAKGGFAAGLRSQFNRILDNPKRQRGFSQAELDAMRKFADGGTMQKLVDLATAFKGVPGAAAMFGATGGNVPLAIAAWGAGMGAKGAVNQGARSAANTMRASAALPNGLPQLPPPRPVLLGSMAVGGTGANPLLSDQRDALARTFGRR